MSERATIPRLPGAFVGRSVCLEQLEALLEQNRLVTVTGAPGIGKTRLAVECARRAVAEAGSRICFCELSECRDATDVSAAVASALGASLDGGQCVSDLLVERGVDLLVLDNFEHLVQRARDVVERWVERTQQTHFLVTSREFLRLPMERRFELDPLEAEQAVALFADKARALRHDFEVSEELRPSLLELVERLDGLPLALELAAARVTTFSPAEMVDRLGERFRLLCDARREPSDRRATLLSAIGWSWDVLAEHEREALRQMTVFRGGFSLAAAEAVLDLSELAPHAWVPDVLESLRHKSLLRGQGHGGEMRFYLLESIREFAAQQRGDLEAAKRRHAKYYAICGREWMPLLNRSDGHRHLARLRRERLNLEAVWERGRDEASELALEAARVLDALYRLVGPPARHRALLDDAVGLAREWKSPPWLAEFLDRRATMNTIGSRYPQAAADLDEALRLCREHDLGRQLEWILVQRAQVHRLTGEAETGVALLEEATASSRDPKLVRIALGHQASCLADLHELDRARDCIERLRALPESDDLRRECELMRRLAYVQFYLGNLPEQRRVNAQALVFARALGDRRLEALCLQGVGDCELAAGNYDRAIAAYEEVLPIHRELANRAWEAILLGNLGGAFHRCERFDEARRCYVRSLEQHRVSGTRPYEGVVLFALGALEFEQAHFDEALNYFRQAEAIAQELENGSDAAGLALCRAWVAIVQDRTDEGVELSARAERLFAALGPEDAGWVAVSLATAALSRVRGGEAVAEQETTLEQARRLVASRPPDSQSAMLALLTCGIESYALDDPDAIDALFRERLARIEEHHRRPDASTSVVRASLHARIVRALVDRRLTIYAARTPPPQPQDETGDVAVVIGRGARWFRLPGQARTDLRRRKSIRLILDHLAQRHAEAPGEGTDVHELFEIGWPGEHIDPESAARRVYWAIRTLRKEGFDELVVTSDDGYLLSPTARIERAND